MSDLRVIETAIVPDSDRLDTLMVIIEERLSPIVSKGEVVPRYYNPGNLFRRVHIVIASEDAPDERLVQPMVGDAALTLHSFKSGLPLFVRSLGWRPRLMRGWASPIVELARRVRPQLVRCHGNQWNAFAAAEIKRRLGVPYVVSLHGNPDVDYFRGRRATTLKKAILGRAIEAVEILGVKNADFVVPVYSPILPYLAKHAIQRYEIIHNAVGYGIAARRSYVIDRAKIAAICVGRQQSLEKDPTPILEALVALGTVHLTLIGDGDLHETLRQKADALGIASRVSFIRSMPNARVLELIASADMMVYCSQNFEISKGCIEAALAGVPTIVGDRGGDPAEELTGGHFLLVPGTAEGFLGAMRRLIEDDTFRERMGRKAASHAHAHWRPEAMERRMAALYRRVVADRRQPDRAELRP